MKRFLSALLAVLMLTVPAALAAPLPTVDEAAQVLAALDIMVGADNGDLMLSRPVTRAEFTKLVVSASPFRASVGPETATDPYPDVPRSHWAAGYIQAAVNAGLVRGNLKGYFEPARDITLAEGVTMVLRLLGYRDSDFSGAYPAGQMALYRSLDLNRGIAVTDPAAALTRGDAMYLFYHLLTTKMKDGTVYLSAVKPKENLLTPAGDISLVALINTAMEGPLVASGDWKTKLPFPLSGAKISRSGVTISPDAIVANDLIYYSKPMRSVWVYSSRATGTIQAITPASAPTAVTVAGKSYAVETPAATYALSDLGSYRVGDSVTLLLGRGGGVAAVLAPNQSGGEVYGLVTAVKSEAYADADGNSYTASTVFVTATDGNAYSYRWDKKNLKPGALVSVTGSGGNVQLKTLPSSTITGKLSSDGKKLGNYPLADDVEILDTYGDSSALRIYPARLAGVSLEENDVRYHLLNERGEISKLILKDVSGDLHQYGVLTSVSELSENMLLLGSYAYDIGGVPGGIPQSSTLYNVHTGPFQLKSEGQTVKGLKNLSELRLSAVDGNSATVGNRKYSISEQAAVYELRENQYYLSSLSAVSGGNFTLSGWYDKPESEGGQIRVILARAQK